MSYLRISLFILFVSVFANCKKGDSTGDGTVSLPPSNLTLASVVNTDKSGSVVFTAAANNALSYDYDFGNGTYQTVPSGIVTYKYAVSGTYTVKVTAKSKSGETVSQTATVVIIVSSATIWSEEFNTDGAPDPAKWSFDLGGGGWGNNELQYYTNRTDNVYISNGTLKIVAKKENFSGSAYTSARLVSKDKFAFKYGKLEIRAKLPSGAGTWPAIWMLGDNFLTDVWPACGEIDIMEHKGNELNKIYATLHYPGHSGGNGTSNNIMIPTATSEFHRYGLDWSATTIKISVDDVVFFTLANNNSVPFNHNFFMILNMAMGGNFGGAVDPAFNSATLEIDYVRLYQ